MIHSFYSRTIKAVVMYKCVFCPALADIIIEGHKQPLTFPLVEEQWGGCGPIKQQQTACFWRAKSVGQSQFNKMNVETGGGCY